MRFPLAVAIIVMGISAAGLAQLTSQTNNTGNLRVKRSPPEKAPRSIVPKTTKSGSSSAANAKDLQTLEHQSSRVAGSSRTDVKKTPAKASALKPVKDQPTPPINIGGTGGSKTRSTQGSDPYKGRLRQKHVHQ